MINKIPVVIQTKACLQETIVDFKKDTIIKVLTYNPTGHTYVRLSRPTEIKEHCLQEGLCLAETILSPVNFVTDQIFQKPVTPHNFFIYSERIIEADTTFKFTKEEMVSFFVIEEHKKNTNKSQVLKDGSVWVRLQFM